MSHRWPLSHSFRTGRPSKGMCDLPGAIEPICPTCGDVVQIEFDWIGRTLERCHCGVRTLTRKAAA